MNEIATIISVDFATKKTWIFWDNSLNDNFDFNEAKLLSLISLKPK